MEEEKKNEKVAGSNPATMKSTKLSLGVLKRCERLKRGIFKRKYNVKSINDVIEKLLDVYDDYVILKEQSKGIVETGEVAEKTLEGEVIEEEEEPSPCPDCAKYSSCTSPNLGDNAREIRAHFCFSPRNACVYRTENKEGMIDCAKDFARTGKIHNVSKDFCDKCWERKKAVLQKMKKVEAPPRTEAPSPVQVQAPPKIEEKLELPKTITCNNSIYRIEEPKHLLNLPCFVNPMFPCPNSECQKLIHQWIQKEGWRQK